MIRTTLSMIFRRIEFRLKYRRFGIHTVGYAIKKSIVTQIFDVRHAIYRIIPHAPDMMDRKTSISNAINAIVCDKHRLTMPNGKFLYFSFIHFFCDFFFTAFFFVHFSEALTIFSSTKCFHRSSNACCWTTKYVFFCWFSHAQCHFFNLYHFEWNFSFYFCFVVIVFPLQIVRWSWTIERWTIVDKSIQFGNCKRKSWRHTIQIIGRVPQRHSTNSGSLRYYSSVL